MEEKEKERKKKCVSRSSRCLSTFLDSHFKQNQLKCGCIKNKRLLENVTANFSSQDMSAWRATILRAALSWFTAQRLAVISYLRFGTTYGGSHLDPKRRWEITTSHCVMTKTNAVLGYFAAETWTHTCGPQNCYECGRSMQRQLMLWSNLIRLQEYNFCNRFLQSAHDGEFEQQILHFSPMRPGFSYVGPWILGTEGIQDLFPYSLRMTKKNGVCCAMSARRGLFNNFRTGAPECKQQLLPRLNWVHSVRRATFSASTVTLVIFSLFSEFLLLILLLLLLLLLIKSYNLYKILACSTTFSPLTLFCDTFFQSRTFVLSTYLGRPEIICTAFPCLVL